MEDTEDRTVLSVSVPLTLKDAIARLAKANGHKITSYARYVLQKHVEEHSQPKRKS